MIEFSADSLRALAERAVPEDVARQLGILPISSDSLPGEAPSWWADHDGMLIPWRYPGGHVEWQARFDTAVRLPDDEESRRYFFRAADNEGFRPGLWEAQPHRPGLTTVIVEGSLKVPCVVAYASSEIGGIYGVAGSSMIFDVSGAPLADFNELIGAERVVVIYDADYATKRGVWDAAKSLREILVSIGVDSVRFAKIPSRTGTSTGVDDYLATVPTDKRSSVLSSLITQADDEKFPQRRRPKKKADDPDDDEDPFRSDFGKPRIQALAIEVDRRHRIGYDEAGPRHPMFYEKGVYVEDETIVNEVLVDVLDDDYSETARNNVLGAVRGLVRNDASRLIPTFASEPLVNFANGMLDLRTGELLPHDPRYLSRVQFSHVSYVPDVTDSDIDPYMEFITGKLPRQWYELEQRLGEIFDPSTVRDTAMYHLGLSGAGKSSLMSTFLERVIPARFQSGIDLRDLVEIPYAPAELFRRVVNIGSELRPGHLEDVSIFKRVVGPDLIFGNKKYGATFQFRNTALCVFLANDVPSVSDAAYFRRIRPFVWSFTHAGREDPGFVERTFAPIQDKIVSRWVDRYRAARYLGHGFVPTPDDIREEFEARSDRVRYFVTTRCRMLDVSETKAHPKSSTLAELHDAFVDWIQLQAETTGTRFRAPGRETFADRLRSMKGVIDTYRPTASGRTATVNVALTENSTDSEHMALNLLGVPQELRHVSEGAASLLDVPGGREWIFDHIAHQGDVTLPQDSNDQYPEYDDHPHIAHKGDVTLSQDPKDFPHIALMGDVTLSQDPNDHDPNAHDQTHIARKGDVTLSQDPKVTDSLSDSLILSQPYCRTCGEDPPSGGTRTCGCNVMGGADSPDSPLSPNESMFTHTHIHSDEDQNHTDDVGFGGRVCVPVEGFQTQIPENTENGTGEATSAASTAPTHTLDPHLRTPTSENGTLMTIDAWNDPLFEPHMRRAPLYMDGQLREQVGELVFSFDLETAGADPLSPEIPRSEHFVRLCGWAMIDETGVECGVMGDDPDTGRDVVSVLHLLAARAETGQPVIVSGHNILGFDLPVLARTDGLDLSWLIRSGIEFIDTFLTPVVLRPPVGMDQGQIKKTFSLDSLASKLKLSSKTIDLAKEASKSGGWHLIPWHEDRLASYALHDVWLSSKILAHAMNREDFAERRDYLRREHTLGLVAASMSATGFAVDAATVQTRAELARTSQAEMVAKLVADHGLPTTGKAPHRSIAGLDALDAAFRSLGVELPRTEKSGRPAMSKPVMTELLDHSDPAVVALAQSVLSLNGIRTVYETVETHMRPVDPTQGHWRVFPSIAMMQASGRWSITDPGMTVMGKRGGRWHEREMFLPDDGDVIMAFDLSQIDARAIAAHSQDPAYLELFGAGRDLHGDVAEIVFGDRSLREQAKAVSHGWNYGMSEKGLAARVGSTAARQFLDRMEKNFPLLIEWKAATTRKAERGRSLDNGFGRILRVDRNRARTQAPALIGQSAARDLLMEWILRLPRHLQQMIRTVVHDEIVLSAPRDDVDQVRSDVLAAVPEPWAPPWIENPIRVPIFADADGPAESWGAVYAK